MRVFVVLLNQPTTSHHFVSLAEKISYLAPSFLLVKKRKRNFKDKIEELKIAARDPMYLEDMKAVNQDFEYVDKEEWE